MHAAVVDPLPDDAEHILVQHNRRDKRIFDVYRVHVKTGIETLEAQNPGNVVGWQTDHAGRVRLGVASDGVNNTVLYRASVADPFKPLFSTDFRTAVTPQFFDARNPTFYAVSNRRRDKAALVRIDPAAPDAEVLVYAHPQVDLDGASWSRVRQTLSLVA